MAPTEGGQVRIQVPVLLLALLVLVGCRAQTAPPPAPRLLLSDLSGQTLMRLHPTTGHLDGPAIPAPGSPSGLATGRGLVALALLGRPYLQLLSFPGLDEIRRIHVGKGCSDVALDGSGRMLAAACPEEGEILLVEVEGGEVRRVPVGGQPHSLVWEQDRIYLTNPGLGTLQWVDPVRGILEGGVPVGLGPRGLAVSGGQVLVALFDANQVAVFQAGRPEEVRRISLAGGPHALVPTGGGALVSLMESGEVAALDLESGQATRIPVGAGAAGMALSPDGQFLFVCCEAAGEVVVLALHDNQVVQRMALPPGARPREVVFARP